ncbi:MAG: hypothetical protein HQK65_19645, partial [Desulfamplus sp.]|nr:hypothetical protein [Desulfamplus sp.]
MERKKEVKTIPQYNHSKFDHDSIERTTAGKTFVTYGIVNQCGHESLIDFENNDLFDDFLPIEIGKLREFARMFIASESSDGSSFGELLLSQLRAFEDRVDEIAHHFEDIGTIEIIQTRASERKFEAGTVVDACLIHNFCGVNNGGCLGDYLICS